MSLKQMFVLVSVLPAILFPLLIVLAAGLGIARWRRLILILSLIALALLIFGAVFLRTIVDVQLSNHIPDSILYSLQPYAAPTILYSSSIGGVGAFLALVLAAQSRAWGWFSILAVAEVISALATLVAFNSFGLELFIGSERALSLFLSPLYATIMSALAGLTILAQLAYAIFGARTTTAVAPAAPVVGMSDDVTLP